MHSKDAQNNGTRMQLRLPTHWIVFKGSLAPVDHPRRPRESFTRSVIPLEPRTPCHTNMAFRDCSVHGLPHTPSGTSPDDRSITAAPPLLGRPDALNFPGAFFDKTGTYLEVCHSFVSPELVTFSTPISMAITRRTLNSSLTHSGMSF
jgi:hypothetical protein